MAASTSLMMTFGDDANRATPSVRRSRQTTFTETPKSMPEPTALQAEPETTGSTEVDLRSRFGELAAAHQSNIRNYVGSLGVACGSIDDIAQDAMIIAYQKFDSYESGTNFAAWVRNIARNLVLNDRRKTKRRYEILNDVVMEHRAAIDPSTYLEDQEADQNQRSALRACLQQLPPNTREVVEARYQRGIEPKQIAEQLGLKGSALRQRLLTARRALYDCVRKRLQEGVA